MKVGIVWPCPAGPGFPAHEQPLPASHLRSSSLAKAQPLPGPGPWLAELPPHLDVQAQKRKTLKGPCFAH